MSGKKAVLISCFDWYEDRLKYIQDYLKKKGYEVIILMSDFNHTEKKYIKNYSNIVEYIHVPKYKKNLSVSRLLSHLIFSKKITKKLIMINPDLIYCLIPPNSLVKELSKFKNENGQVLLYDIIDMWPESFPSSKNNLLPFRIWKNIRNKYIGFADKIVVECEYYKDLLNMDCNKFEVLRLIKEPITDNKERKEFNEEFCLGYLGSINYLIDIDKICAIVKRLSEFHSVLVRVIGDGEQRDYFIDSLKKSGASVEYYGKIFDEKKLLYYLGNCDFGLNVYKDNLSIGLTMKSISYFQIGIPILNSIKGDTFKFVNDYGVGINILGKSENEICKLIENKECKNMDIFDEYFSANNIDKRLMFLDELL